HITSLRKLKSLLNFLLCQRMLWLASQRRPRVTCKHSIPALIPSHIYTSLLIILASLISTQTLHAVTPTPTPTTRTVKFGWRASPSDDVVGYKIFWGTGSYNYQNVRDVRNVLTTSLTLSTTNK